MESSAKIKYRLGLYTFIFLALTFNSAAQSFDGLNQLQGSRIKTYYSNGVIDQAKKMADRLDKVSLFFKELVAFEPTVTLLVLTPDDWSKYTRFPFYGMPHYNENKTLIVASEDNDFWKSFVPMVEKLPVELAKQITSSYSENNGALTMRPFFDLLAIHELGHAFHFQGGLTMQRKWIGELFANMTLHTYIAEKEPDLLPALTVFPNMVVSSTERAALPFTTLNDLETRYDEIGQRYANNYGWYQCRWHMAAGDIYDKGGLPVFKKLWYALKEQKEPLEDHSLAVFLAEKVHQSVADVQLNWDK